LQAKLTSSERKRREAALQPVKDADDAGEGSWRHCPPLCSSACPAAFPGSAALHPPLL